MQALVSDHIIKAVDNCVIKGIEEDGVKKKRHTAPLKLNLTMCLLYLILLFSMLK